jgi:hypothetical protein
MIRFRTDITLETISDYDANNGNNCVDALPVEFKQGDMIEGYLTAEDDGDWVDIIFNDGSVATNVLIEDVEEI